MKNYFCNTAGYDRRVGKLQIYSFSILVVFQFIPVSMIGGILLVNSKVRNKFFIT